MNPNAPATPPARPTGRVVSIDALRGFVMLLMLVDHVREFFVHGRLGDPMDVEGTAPALFFTRLATHLCAPVFVALTGTAAFLYGNAKQSPRAASEFLWKRGLFLVALEVTVVAFAWSFRFPPKRFYLQVIWVIGLSMVALSALLHLPRMALLGVGAALVLGHNLLDPIHFEPDSWGSIPWSILHDRGILELPFGLSARTSYPLLPWIGVMALGYVAGPWFGGAQTEDTVKTRTRFLTWTGLGGLGLFLVLRFINVYGEPLRWSIGSTPLRTAMGFLNVTKYPPSAAFVLLTLGLGALLLIAFERLPSGASRVFTTFGAAPLFFYVLHLYLLHGLQLVTGWEFGSVGPLWVLAACVALPCGLACRWFASAKRKSDAWWMRYL